MSKPASLAPLVSIITIVYNGGKYIENAIRSVMQQTYGPIEYIIIDGGSTDTTLSIIKRYDSFINHWISEKDAGISDAFNKGLRLVKGEIIGILNADDWYEPGTVEKAVNRMVDCDVVYGDMRLWKGGKMDFLLKANHSLLEREMTINHPTVFVRRSCYDRFGFFDTHYKCAMDYDMILRFAVNGCRFGYIPELLTNMSWEGFSDTRWLLGCRETLAIKNKYLPNRKWRNQIYFYRHVAAISIPKFMIWIGLERVVRIYRSLFSRQQKVYE